MGPENRHALRILYLSLLLVSCGGGDGTAGLINITTATEDFSRARVVIGQPDFSTRAGTGRAAGTLNLPRGSAAHANGTLYLPDTAHNRVLGFTGLPGLNGANADFVLGQNDFTATGSATTQSGLFSPQDTRVAGGRLLVTDHRNNRVLIHDPAPGSGPGSADVVLGQPDFTSSTGACSGTGLNGPAAVSATGGKVVVADAQNNRVLIWNSIPASNGVSADQVIGQDSFTRCAANDRDQDGSTDGAQASRETLRNPSAVWTDGQRLVVSDTGNNRILIWNSFPSANFAPADQVLGQSDFSRVTANDDDQDRVADGLPSARTLNNPSLGLDSDGDALWVADTGNNRVLVWSSFPAANFARADRVLGQGDFDQATANDDNQDGTPDGQPSARTLASPAGIRLIDANTVVVTDRDNLRYLVFDR